ncbi:MAG: hypothetical protein DCC49_13640 [Acidobacteria bacterium]|nr:MAG: hypothetical protein DCC49_13640 [Acidobacteriota bacterium]
MLRAKSLAVVVLLVALAGCNSNKPTETTVASPSPSTAEGKHHSEMSAAELEKWQKDLNIVGCWAGPVDGKLGPETEHAVKQFQTAEKLTVDGKLGPQTESALGKAVSEKRTVCGGGHTPTPSATSTHSASPACTMDLLTNAARAHHGASFKQMHAFACAQPWATASVELTGGSRTQDLFKASGDSWAWTDRTEPCSKGEVPASIRATACA